KGARTTKGSTQSFRFSLRASCAFSWLIRLVFIRLHPRDRFFNAPRDHSSASTHHSDIFRLVPSRLRRERCDRSSPCNDTRRASTALQRRLLCLHNFQPRQHKDFPLRPTSCALTPCVPIQFPDARE